MFFLRAPGELGLSQVVRMALGNVLGEGAQGVVYKGRRTNLCRTVACTRLFALHQVPQDRWTNLTKRVIWRGATDSDRQSFKGIRGVISLQEVVRLPILD